MMQSGEGGDVSITIDRKLDCVVVSGAQRCIFRVHDVMKSANRKAYEPVIMSIGPYHRNTPHLQLMEEQKLRFLKLLLQRRNERVSKYVGAMKLLEGQARQCYAESVEHIPSDEFVEMMVLDGCFVVELMLKFQVFKCSWIATDKKIKDDPLFRMEWTLNFLQRDLMLFENQLPYFVLFKLYEMIEFPCQPGEFTHLALEFFNDLFPGYGKNCKKKHGGSQDDIKHLLDLIHRNWSTLKIEPDAGKAYTMDNIELIGSSTELADAGIKFQNIENEVSFDIVFKHGSLQIPVITIEDRTESFLRNLIAFEQHCGDTGYNIVTDYVTFFGCLIKSVGDVTELSRHGIIRNFVGDNAVYQMFSTMTDCITGPSRNFHYAEIFREVNSHCHKPINSYMASLRRSHMHSSWGIISILAASLLLLSLLQVIFQILSWKRGLH